MRNTHCVMSSIPISMVPTLPSACAVEFGNICPPMPGTAGTSGFAACAGLAATVTGASPTFGGVCGLYATIAIHFCNSPFDAMYMKNKRKTPKTHSSNTANSGSLTERERGALFWALDLSSAFILFLFAMNRPIPIMIAAINPTPMRGIQPVAPSVKFPK
jgi:hypothetical protein